MVKLYKKYGGKKVLLLPFRGNGIFMMKNGKENALDIMLLAQRIIAAAAFLFLTVGETLHFNAFVQNAIDLSLPYPHLLGLILIMLGFLCPLCILTGIMFRAASFVMAAVTVAGGIIFFAGDFNKVNVVGCVLALALLAGFIFYGPGAISLSSILKDKKNKNTKKRLPIH
jgi:uncharacterized membrane protein YphA (DoxX/SURF4 family)